MFMSFYMMNIIIISYAIIYQFSICKRSIIIPNAINPADIISPFLDYGFTFYKGLKLSSSIGYTLLV
jgi:hypothetical protein